MRKAIFRFLLLPLLIAVGASLLWLRSSLPPNSERLALDGPAAEIRVSRDAFGIPTVAAASDRDAAFALGFVHAQDRLFQMDLTRRLAAGRLAEWFGARALGSDRYFRTIGLFRAAEQQYALLSPELQGVLDAYAAGVNAYLAQRRGALPPEYYLINAAPEPWRPADTLAWGKLMAQQLAGSFRRELLHARLAQGLSPEELQILYPPYPKDAPIAVSDAAAWLKGLPLGGLYAQIPGMAEPDFASNNWVVDGKHSASGKPVLANDPHLGLSAPSVWYLARIETPQRTLAGATAPGAPFVVIGHNRKIAWGFTNTESDVSDLFIERLDPADKARYLTPQGSEPFVMRQEKILVRGGDPVSLDVRETRHGPVLSDLAGSASAKLAAPDTVLALQATFLQGEDRSPQAFWGINRAANWDEFRAALKDFVAPQQNMVYADIDGNIGFFAPGRIPIRGKGDGWLPSPGWSGEWDWTGYIPFDQLPAAVNPPSGRIVSANNKIVPESYRYFLGRDWDLPNRAARINQLLETMPQQSAVGSAAIQADTLSLMARDLLPLMLRIEPRSKAMTEALDRLKAWDSRMNRDQVAPLLFVAWLREFNRTILADKLGPAFDDYWDASPHPNVIRLILTEHAEWCNERAPPVAKTCAEQLAVSLERALGELGQRYGTDMDGWQWGRAHPALFTNQVWASIPVLRSWFATALPANGGYDTIDRGGSRLADGEPYADVHGPTLRMIVDLADIDAARFIIAPGQSGNALSPHYSDLMEPWRDHAYVTLGGASGRAELILAPK
jgi:penicillin amidase